MTKDWYRTDERENAIDFLEKAACFYKSADSHRWKWIVTSLHGTLYGFAIINLAGTDWHRVKNGRKLISAPEAFKRCTQECYMKQTAFSRILILNEVEIRAIRKLSAEFRNNFEHFSPKSWSIQIAAMREIVEPASRVIRFLALESGNISLRQRQRVRIKRALKVLAS